MKSFFWNCLNSKTMWFNFIMAIFSGLEGNFSLLQPYLPGNFYAYTTVILIVGNKFLRTQTNKALNEK